MTDYTFRHGASTVKKIVKQAKLLGIESLAITDVTNLSGAMEFSGYASEEGIKPIIGCTLNIRIGSRTGQGTFLSMNADGYRNLCRMLEFAYVPKNGKHSDPVIDIQDIERFSDDLIFMTGPGDRGVGKVICEISDGRGRLEWLSGVFRDRMYVEICRRTIPDDSEYGCSRYDNDEQLVMLASGSHGIVLPMVATIDIQYASHTDSDAWNLLRASREGETIVVQQDVTGYGLMADDIHVSVDVPPAGYHMPTHEIMADIFSDLPEALENTVNIGYRCNFIVEKRKPILPDYPVPEGKTTIEFLHDVAVEGLLVHLKNHEIPVERHREYLDRLDYETGVIDSMGFAGYFLIVQDFIRWAKNNDIPVGPGRGSGAGSVVAWSLLITDVDPIRHGLLFERFLNPERVSMPDFDIDFCRDRRDEVINYVREKYGQECVCAIATFGKIMAKTAIDDIRRSTISGTGSPLGYSDAEILKSPFSHNKTANMSIDAVLNTVYDGVGSPIEKKQTRPFREAMFTPIIDENGYHPERDRERMNALRNGTFIRGEGGFRVRGSDLWTFLKAAQKIEGLNRNLSSHAAGIVIGDRELSSLFPIIRDEKSLSPMSAFSAKYVEMSGGVKFDFLGLKNLTIIDETVKLAKRIHGDVRDPRHIYEYDEGHEALYEMVSSGHTVGVFQLSSGGMVKTLQEVKPTCFADIVAIVSLYRPGPMDIIPEYAARKNGTSPVVYPVERLTKGILEETYGFMVYQEQVMQIAMVCAGYTLGGADLLRRAMGKKNKVEMERQRGIFITGCAENDIPENEASDLFDTIAKFADYGFNKSHAVAYSLIAWQTMYLKVHYPECFYAVLSDLSPAGISQTIAEMKIISRPIEMVKPDVNISELMSIPEGEQKVRMGLNHIPSMKTLGQEIVRVRGKNRFRDIMDFGTRTGGKMPLATYAKLAESGALDGFSRDSVPNRRKLGAFAEWFAMGNRKADERQGGLFDLMAPSMTDTLPKTADMIPSLKKDDSLKDVPVSDIPDWPDRGKKIYNALGYMADGDFLIDNYGVIAGLGCRPVETWNNISRLYGGIHLDSCMIAGTVLSIDTIVIKDTTAARVMIDDGFGIHRMVHYLGNDKNTIRQREVLETSFNTMMPVIFMVSRSERGFLSIHDVDTLTDKVSMGSMDIVIFMEDGNDGREVMDVLEKYRHVPEEISIDGFAPEMRNRMSGGIVSMVSDGRVAYLKNGPDMLDGSGPDRYMIDKNVIGKIREIPGVRQVLCAGDEITQGNRNIIDADGKIHGCDADYHEHYFMMVSRLVIANRKREIVV